MKYILVILLLFLCSGIFGDDDDNFAEGIIHFYRQNISKVRGFPCPMVPSCSAYGLECFHKYDFFTALLKTADRLTRCGSDLDSYPVVWTDWNKRYYDPVDPSSGGIPETVNVVDRNAREEKSSIPGGGLSFAMDLQNKGDYQNAILEYLRYMYYQHDATDIVLAQTGYLYSNYRLGRFAAVTEYFQNELKGTTNYGFISIAGLAYFKRSDMFRAMELFTQMVSNGDGEIREKGFYYNGVAYARKYEWRKALDNFDSVKNIGANSEKLVSYREFCREGMNFQERSPLLAGVLSVIPGLGYLYDGLPVTAISALIFNGLLAWGTYECVREGNVPLAIIAGSTTLVWYAGGIYGSISEADRANEKFKNQLSLKFDFDF